jgi:hypothetical protein
VTRLAVFQGALAIVERARLVQSIELRTAESLITSLSTAALSDEPVPAIAKWIVATLSPSLPELERPDRYSGQTAYESRILQALGGPTPGDETAFEWEGQQYRVDIAGAERLRIQRIRAIVPTPGLDEAIASGRADDLADALTALAYLPALGDPDGPVSLSPDVVSRHDFGVGSRAPGGQAIAWSTPQERTGDGQPWRVSGALMGLDLALARVSLRRLVVDEMPPVPTINMNDLLVIARTIRVLDPFQLNDSDRDAIVGAISKGRARVRAAGDDRAALAALAREAGFTRAALETLDWTLNQPEVEPESLFGLRDLFWVGRPALDSDRVRQWGVLSEPFSGRLRTWLPGPEAWDEYGGRPDTGMLGALVPDLTLGMAVQTAALGVPARLVPAILRYATQDFWHDVESRFPDDWPAMVRQAGKVPMRRVEDYVAALAGDGPLRPR